MRCLYVFNQLSGGNKEIYYHEKINSTLKEIYDNVDLFEVGNENISSKLSKINYDDVICSGGDGSITLLVNELINFGFKGNIGYQTPALSTFAIEFEYYSTNEKVESFILKSKDMPS